MLLPGIPSDCTVLLPGIPSCCFRNRRGTKYRHNDTARAIYSKNSRRQYVSQLSISTSQMVVPLHEYLTDETLIFCFSVQQKQPVIRDTEVFVLLDLYLSLQSYTKLNLESILPQKHGCFTNSFTSVLLQCTSVVV